jgi:hypothetical protein
MPIPFEGLQRKGFVASAKKSARQTLHSIKCDWLPYLKPIASGISPTPAANCSDNTKGAALLVPKPYQVRVGPDLPKQHLKGKEIGLTHSMCAGVLEQQVYFDLPFVPLRDSDIP